MEVGQLRRLLQDKSDGARQGGGQWWWMAVSSFGIRRGDRGSRTWWWTVFGAGKKMNQIDFWLDQQCRWRCHFLSWARITLLAEGKKSRLMFRLWSLWENLITHLNRELSSDENKIKQTDNMKMLVLCHFCKCEIFKMKKLRLLRVRIIQQVDSGKLPCLAF